jgi:hypothetical protein
MKDTEELTRLYGDVERSLIRRFLTEHELIPTVMRAGTEEIRDWFGNVIRRFMDEGETGTVGLLALWLVLESPRDTLIKLAIWLETQDSPDDEDARPGSDE